MRRGLAATTTLVGLIAVGACLPGAGPPLLDKPDAAAPGGPSLADDAGARRQDVDLGDPFGIDGLVPSHGPWTGGTRAQISGRGFSSKLRVWIGGTELDPSAIFASDPSRAAIQTPPGTPGPADVKVRDDLTAKERTLAGGFTYDAFVVVPDTGGTTGGTRIALQGSGTAWQAGTTVAVGGAPCTGVNVVDGTHLECATPPGAPGTRDVTVTAPDGALLQARDAFTYSDSPDGYRGGLAGGALSGTLHVLAYDAWVGTPLVQARVLAGDSLATAVRGMTNGSGVAVLADPALQGNVTVTVAAKCHAPITFVDVPVDTVTVYLDPVLDPACGTGDPPSTGGRSGINAGEIDGELVWAGGIELGRATWTNVPAPTRPTERQAAYVFGAAGSPLQGWGLPPATSAITPLTAGAHGYAYAIDAFPGNQTVYALAGIEDRSVNPPRFVPYAMGVVRGVGVEPQVRTTGADIRMETLLDHRVLLAPTPPSPGPRGPDRLSVEVAVSLGQSGFAIVPAGFQQAMLPVSGNLGFFGLPALDGALAGEAYVVSASAVTGPSNGVPASVVSRVRTTDANAAVAIGGFLAVPVATEPSASTWGGTHVAFLAPGAWDLAVIDLSAGGGLVSWRIVAPAGRTSIDVPDLRCVPGDMLALPAGALDATIYVARLDGFSYGALRYGQLGSGAWSAYAFDSVHGTY
jgi:IPT/TIG domain